MQEEKEEEKQFVKVMWVRFLVSVILFAIIGTNWYFTVGKERLSISFYPISLSEEDIWNEEVQSGQLIFPTGKGVIRVVHGNDDSILPPEMKQHDPIIGDEGSVWYSESKADQSLFAGFETQDGYYLIVGESVEKAGFIQFVKKYLKEISNK